MRALLALREADMTVGPRGIAPRACAVPLTVLGLEIALDLLGVAWRAHQLGALALGLAAVKMEPVAHKFRHGVCRRRCRRCCGSFVVDVWE